MKPSVFTLPILVMAISSGVFAQSWHPGDIKWISSQQFARNVEKWNSTHQLGEDDNFFISRVRPAMRFHNRATQIDPSLEAMVNDKRLCAWLPINTDYSGDNKNALPTGEFDSECFTMWSYIDHWGNWTAPMGAMPGSFSDVAHKNGVAVSSVASIPFGAITSQWADALDGVIELDPAVAARMLVYYGMDGLGYNSEFDGYPAEKLERLRSFHESLLKHLNEEYAKVSKGYDMAENLWYDGTSDDGEILFDRGLDNHNIKNWGGLGEERSSLFFNYNWNKGYLLGSTVENAFWLANDRNPLYIYCGINMQGGEPRATKPNWELLKGVPLSIGLWGAHSENMFWQNRYDNGQDPLLRQQTYQQRIEQWFSGGNHNPADLPKEMSRNTICHTGDSDFHGMASFMSARSVLCWDLGVSPFITNFNVGNGKFFNWKGERMNGNEWYNIGIQDYMPTWRWWGSENFLGKDASASKPGIHPSFCWDDAYFGGSCLRLKGDTRKEYLHLFKTAFLMRQGDRLTVKFKPNSAEGKVTLVGSVEGKEGEVSLRLPLAWNATADSNGWQTSELILDELTGEGKTLAMLALEFEDCSGLDLLLGEISLRRGSSVMPVMPEVTSSAVLRNSHSGIDAKIIFNVPNSKRAGEVCYNDEVGAQMFKIYSQEEGGEISLRGATTSWAAMSYATPFEGDENGNGRIRFGVSAVAPDLEAETAIAWGEWLESGEYVYSDEIMIDKTTITPGERFTLSAVDSKRKMEWEITRSGDGGKIVAESDGCFNSWTCPGLSKTGYYDLHVRIPGYDAPRIYRGYIAVTDPARGRLPEIEKLAANGSEASITVLPGAQVKLEYEGREADGIRSRGLVLKEHSFGLRLGDVLESEDGSFSIAGWIKIDEFPGIVNWIDIARRDGEWPRNNWGWLWTSIAPDGTIQNYSQDYSPVDKGASTRVIRYVFGESGESLFNKGQWNHFAMVFDRDASKTRTLLYINGKRLEGDWDYLSSSDYSTNDKVLESGSTEDYIHAYKALHPDNYVIIGGTRRSGRDSGGNGLTGVLDDFQVWDIAMTETDVERSMEGIDTEEYPEGLAAFFDFESEPDEENMFACAGGKEGAKGGYFQLRPSDGAEGQSFYDFITPAFAPGNPFVEGKDYRIITKPEWRVSGGSVVSAGGSDREGEAILRLPGVEADYSAQLVLKNELGESRGTFNYIKVSDPDSVDSIEADGLSTYIVGNDIILEISRPGQYSLRLYDSSGRLAAFETCQCADEERIKIHLPGSGVYVLSIERDGNSAGGMKFIVR